MGNALDSAELLRELLANAEDASPEEEQLIHELHVSCGTLRLALQRLAASETQPDCLSEWTGLLHPIIIIVMSVVFVFCHGFHSALLFYL